MGLNTVNDRVKALHTQLVNDSYDVGDIDDFSYKLTDPNKAKALYDAIAGKYDIGEFDDFYQKVNPSQETQIAPEATPDDVKAGQQMQSVQDDKKWGTYGKTPEQLNVEKAEVESMSGKVDYTKEPVKTVDYTKIPTPAEKWVDLFNTDKKPNEAFEQHKRRVEEPIIPATEAEIEGARAMTSKEQKKILTQGTPGISEIAPGTYINHLQTDLLMRDRYQKDYEDTSVGKAYDIMALDQLKPKVEVRGAPSIGGFDPIEEEEASFTDNVWKALRLSGVSAAGEVLTALNDQSLMISEGLQSVFSGSKDWSEYWDRQMDITRDNQQGVKDRLLSSTEQMPEGFAGMLGGALPFVGMAITSIMLKNPTLAAATTATFAEMGYGGVLNSYDEYKKQTGEVPNEMERRFGGILGAAVMAVAIPKYIARFATPVVKKIIPKAMTAWAASNPQIANITGKAVMEDFMKKNPMAAKQLMKSMAASTGHSVLTMETIGLGKLAIDQFLVGKDINPIDYWNTAVEGVASGVMFGVLTAPFGIYSQNRANIQRRSQQSHFRVMVDQKGNPIEVFQDNKGNWKGVTPSGKEVKVTAKQAGDAFTMTMLDFNNVSKKYKETKNIDDNIERQAMSGNIEQALWEMSKGTGFVDVPENLDGFLYAKYGTDGKLKGLTFNGSLVNLPEGTPLVRQRIYEVRDRAVARMFPEADPVPVKPYLLTGRHKESRKGAIALLQENNFTEQDAVSLENALKTATPEQAEQLITGAAWRVKGGMKNVNGTNVIDKNVMYPVINMYKDLMALKVRSEGIQKQLGEAREKADNFVAPKINKSTDAVTYVQIDGIVARVVKGRVIVNEDLSIDKENSEDDFYYEDEKGIHPAKLDRIEAVIEHTPAEEARAVAEEVVTTPILSDAANEEVRPYSVGEVVAVEINGIQVRGEIVATDGKNYTIQDVEGGQMIIEPLQIIQEENLEGLQDGVVVDYFDDDYNPKQGIAQVDPKSLINGVIVIDNQEVPLENVIRVTDKTIPEVRDNEGMAQESADIKGDKPTDPEQKDTEGVLVPNPDTPVSPTLTAQEELPVTKDGKVDTDKLTPTQAFRYAIEQSGPETAIADLKQEIEFQSEELTTKQTELSEAKRMNEKIKIREEIKAIEAQLEEMKAMVPKETVANDQELSPELLKEMTQLKDQLSTVESFDDVEAILRKYYGDTVTITHATNEAGAESISKNGFTAVPIRNRKTTESQEGFYFQAFKTLDLDKTYKADNRPNLFTAEVSIDFLMGQMIDTDGAVNAKEAAKAIGMSLENFEDMDSDARAFIQAIVGADFNLNGLEFYATSDTFEGSIPAKRYQKEDIIKNDSKEKLSETKAINTDKEGVREIEGEESIQKEKELAEKLKRYVDELEPSGLTLEEFKTLGESGEYAIITGENPNDKPMTEEENLVLNAAAKEWLIENGFNPIDVVGNYFGAIEKSFLVPNMTDEQAKEAMEAMGQQSVVTSSGLLFDNGELVPRVGSPKIDQALDQNYSIININGEKIRFSETLQKDDTENETGVRTDGERTGINQANDTRGSKEGTTGVGSTERSYDQEFDLNKVYEDANEVDNQKLTDEVHNEARLQGIELSEGESAGVAATVKLLIGKDPAGDLIKKAVAAMVEGKKSGRIVSKEINRKPQGSGITKVNSSYNEAVANNAKDGTKNIWVRQSMEEGNADRTLMVQVSSFLLGETERSKTSRYFDKLYRTVPGYDRTPDFWEIPTWMGRAAAIQPNTDVYVVRNEEEASRFIKDAGYGNVIFSALDVAKPIITSLSKANPDQKIQIGTYTPYSEVKDLKNVTTFTTLEEYAKQNGLDYKYAYNYPQFEGTSSIPRIRTSEGCKFKCAFCSNVKKVAPMKWEEIQQQVDGIKMLDSKFVYVGDKAFGQADNLEVFEKIYDEIKKYNPDFEGFIVQTSALDFANTKRMSPEFLAKSHIKYVELGIETYNDDILTKIRKPHSHAKHVKAALDNARANDVKIIPNLIVGLSGKNPDGTVWSETEDTYKNTLDFLNDNRDVISHVNVYNLALYEGTELGDEIGAKIEADKNENLAEKSFWSDPKVHQKYAGIFADWGFNQLDRGARPKLENNKAVATQGFFSDVVTGKSDKYKPHTPWKPLLPVGTQDASFIEDYNKMGGNFDEHIATSIPGFRDIQIKTGIAVAKLLPKGGLVYDIGGSEGTWIKTVTQRSEGAIKSISVDPNKDMVDSFNLSTVEGSVAVAEAFYEGFEDEGITYKVHEPKEKADVVHESMTFQFISSERDGFVKEVITKYLKDDGIFLTEEKLIPEDQEQYLANEAKKDKDFKALYYSPDQITKKAEAILTGMEKDQAKRDEYVALLKKNFKYVEEYWDSGNFKGYAATNSGAKMETFMKSVGNTDTEFSEKNILVKGVEVKEAPKSLVVNGIDRSSVNSNGRPIHSTEQGVINFWKWFGDSKVVDEQGRPLVVYHGANKDFESFRDGYINFLSTNPKVASVIGRSIIPAYVKLLNPITLDAKAREWDNITYEGKKIDTVDLGRIAYKEGHDGVILKNIYEKGEKGDNVMFFDPNQIKSATGNSGEFSEESNNISLQVEGSDNLPDHFHKHMTDDGAGNYVFFHKGNFEGSVIDSTKGKPHTYTTDRAPDTTYYYTNQDDSESMVIGEKRVVLVPKSKVYPFNEDPNYYLEPARELFRASHYGQGNQAFSPDMQLLFISELAHKDGYEMVVAQWGRKIALRAQTLTPMESMTEGEYEVYKREQRRLETIDKESYNNIISAAEGRGLAIYVPTLTEEEFYKALEKAVADSKKNDPIGFQIENGIYVSEAGFYSPTEEALSKLSQNKGTPTQMKAMLIRNGAKLAEMDWMEWDKFVEGKTSITKDDILEWIYDKRIELEEVVSQDITDEQIQTLLDDEAGEDMDWEEAREYLSDDQEAVKFSQYTLPGGEFYKEFKLTIPVKDGIDMSEFYVEEVKGEGGRIGYRGVSPNTTGAIKPTRELAEADVKTAIKTYAKINRDNNSYKSPHFSERNIVVHFRTDERTFIKPNPLYKDPKTHVPNFDTDYDLIENETGYKVKPKNGDEYFVNYPKKILEDNNMTSEDLKVYLMKHTELGRKHSDFKDNRKNDSERVLFIEELQSDWAQKGKKEGFFVPEKYVIANSISESDVVLSRDENDKNIYNVYYNDKIIGRYTSNNISSAKQNAVDVYNSNLPRTITKTGQRGNIPNMPFQKTDQWTSLAFRKMIKYAAENGFDRIAWTTGEQQSARYPGGSEDAEEARLRGMQGFYDQIVPKIANKLGKPFGTQVEDIDFNDGKSFRLWHAEGDVFIGKFAGGYTEIGQDNVERRVIPAKYKTVDSLLKEMGLERSEVKVVYSGQIEGESNVGKQQSIKITDEMRDSVVKGVPMFYKNNKGEVYGFYYDKKVYLNPTKINANTPFHEFAHPWVDMIEKEYKELFQKGKELIMASEYFEAVNKDPNYKEKPENERIKESMARGIGDNFEYIHRDKGLKERLQAWIKDVWAKIAKFMGLDKMTSEEISNLTLGDFLDLSVADMLSGKTGTAPLTGDVNSMGNYSVHKMNIELYKNTAHFTEFVNRGQITNDRPLSDFNGRSMIVHKPDQLATGQLIYYDGTKVSLGGGAYFTPFNMGTNVLWAVTDRGSATGMINKLNQAVEEARRKGQTSINIALTASGLDKAQGNIAFGHAFVSTLNMIVNDPKASVTKNTLKKALIKALGEKALDRGGKLRGFEIKLTMNTPIEEVIKIAKETLSTAKYVEESELAPSDVPTLDDVRMFNEILAREFASSITNVKSIGRIKEVLKEMHPEYKGRKGSVSKTSLLNSMLTLTTEPGLRGVEPNIVYGFLGVGIPKKGESFKVQTFEGNESYGLSIAVVNEETQKISLHMLPERIPWYEMFYGVDGKDIDPKDMTARMKALDTLSGVSQLLLKKDHEAPAEISPVAYHIIGSKGAKRLDARDKKTGIVRDGIEARLENSRMRGLDEAKFVEGKLSQTKLPENVTASAMIKYKTGWERGADNKWKYELMDIKSTTKELLDIGLLNNVNLQEIYGNQPEFKELAVAYPEVKNVRILPVYGMPKNAYAYLEIVEFNGVVKMTIGINADAADAAIAGDKKVESRMNEAIVHEIQHVIQLGEGFEQGTDPQTISNERAEQVYQGALKSGFLNGKTPLSIEDKKVVAYYLTMGESEARNAAVRAKLSKEERRLNTLENTSTVMYKDQVKGVQNVKFSSDADLTDALRDALGESPEEIRNKELSAAAVRKALEKENVRLTKKEDSLKETIDNSPSEKETHYSHTLIKNQIKSIKVGYWLGAKDQSGMIKEVQKGIVNYANKNIPMSEAGKREIKKLLTIVKDTTDPDKLRENFEKIDALTAGIEAKITRGKEERSIERILEWATSYRKVGSGRYGKFPHEIVKQFDKLKEVDEKSTELKKIINSNKRSEQEKIDADIELNALWEEIDSKENKNLMDLTMLKLIEMRRGGAKASDALISAINEDLKTLYEAGKEGKTTEDIIRAMDRTEDKDIIKDAVRNFKIKDAGLLKKVLVGAENFTVNAMGNWGTLLTMVGGKEAREEFTLLVDQALEDMAVQEKFNDVLDVAKDAYGLKNKNKMLLKLQDLGKDKYTLEQPILMGRRIEGDPMELSQLHLIDIFLAIQQPDIERDTYLTYGDIVEKDGERDYKAQEAIGRARITDLLYNLSPGDKAFAFAMQDVVQNYHDKVNKVFVKIFNRDLPTVDNYWMSTFSKNEDVNVFNNYMADAKHPGFTKERGKSRSPRPMNAFVKFSKHVQQAEWYINMALPLDRIERVFRDTEVKTLIEQHRGQGFYNTLIRNLGDYRLNASTRELSDFERIGGSLLGNWVSAKIALTPSVPLKQLISSINYSQNMPAAKWTTGFIKGVADIKGTWKQMHEDIPYLSHRFGAGYSEAMQYALDKAAAMPKASNYHQAMKNIGTIGTRAGDITAIVYGGKPYFDYLVKEKGLSKEQAVRIFMEETLDSQQAPYSSSLSWFQNSKNPLAKALFTFANTAAQYQRKMFEAAQDYQHGDIDKKKLGKIFWIYEVLNNIAYVWAGVLVNWLYGKSLPKLKNFAKEVAAQMFFSLYGGVPIIRDITQSIGREALGLRTFETVLPVSEQLGTISSSAIKILKGEDKTGKAWDMLLDTLELGGVPAFHAKRLYKAVFERDEQVFKELVNDARDSRGYLKEFKEMKEKDPLKFEEMKTSEERKNHERMIQTHESVRDKLKALEVIKKKGDLIRIDKLEKSIEKDIERYKELKKKLR